MACGSCGARRNRAGVVAASGRQIAGYRLTFPPGAGQASVMFSSEAEAKQARKDSGIVGSTIETIYQ